MKSSVGERHEVRLAQAHRVGGVSVHSRTKGRTAERQVELAFQAAGFSTDRALGGRTQVAGDIVVEGVAVEVRRREKQSIEAWAAAHEAETPEHLTPVLVARTSRNPWRVTMRLDDFLDLLREARFMRPYSEHDASNREETK